MSLAFPTISWANGTNIYEVNIRKYTAEGTIAVICKHIPWLKDIGVEISWPMPITSSIEKITSSLSST
jgi:hypothetical protein